MTVENNQPEQDVFNMSSDEFNDAFGSIDTFSTSTDESAPVDSSNDEVVEQADETEIPTGEEDVEPTNDITEDPDADTGEYDSATSEDDESEQTSVSDEQTEELDEFNYEAAYKDLLGEPLKANGKEYNIESVEDARKLMQMGMGFYKNMEALKPKRNLLAMLEDNKVDAEKLNFAIDLLNKNPQAINKLVSDLDLSEIVDDSNSNYTPSNNGVSDQVLNVREALQEIEHTDTYSRTVNVLGTEWDAKSREIVQENTHLIGTINSHVANGMFDAINAEVDKRIMFGSIPSSTPKLVAYKMVGDEMYANGNQQAAPALQGGQQQGKLQANARTPIRKPSEQVRQNKIAASKPRNKTTQRQAPKAEDVFAMSDNEFNNKYGFK